MKSETLSQFLLKRLTELGTEYVYGVPGDYNLALMDTFSEVPSLRFVGTCNELNAVYAADGHARISHLPGVVIVTYGVGDLAVLSGVAGAFAERVPLIVISGTPPAHAQQLGRPMHHTLGDGKYGDVLDAFKPFTVASAVLTLENARGEVDRVISDCLLHRRPVYIQVASDLAERALPAQMRKTPTFPTVLHKSPSEVLSRVLSRINAASSPAILLDAAVDRFQLVDSLRQAIDHHQIPFALMTAAKGLIEESHPAYRGIYNGAWSSTASGRTVESADCLLGLGVNFTDTCSGLFTQDIDPRKYIDVQVNHIVIDGVVFDGVGLVDVVDALNSAESKTAVGRTTSTDSPLEMVPPPGALLAANQSLDHQQLWAHVQEFLKPGDLILADNGSALAGVLGLHLPKGATLITQPNWGAIGYSLPATLGAMLAAPARRTLLFIGDGAFQMTAQELSTLLRHGLNPVVFVLNNKGYTIERLMRGANAEYNDVAPWRYQRLMDAFGAERQQSFSVSSVGELRQTLTVTPAFLSTGMVFVELLLPKMDAPSKLFTLAKAFADYDAGIGHIECSGSSIYNVS